MNLHRAPLLIGALAIAWIIQIVAFPQIDSLLFFERILAVNRTSDQSLLAKVYAEDLDWRVTDAALEGLTDQNALAKIVLTKRGLFQYKSKKALSKLNDQALLAKVALAAEDNYYDSAGGMRGRAVEKLTDQTLLATVALDAKGSSVRESAVSKLDENTLNKMGMWVKPELTKQVQDQELLKKIIESANDIEVCKAAVSTLSDQTYLVKLALENERGPIGSTAVNRLTDPTALAKVFVEAKEQHIREAAERKLRDAQMLASLTDQSLLAKFALEDKVYHIREAAVRNLADQTILAKIALQDKDPRVRDAAVRQLTDQSALAKVTLEEDVDQIRENAVRKITDQGLLAKLVVETTEGDYDYIRLVVVRQITDQALLAKIAVEHKYSGVREIAVEKLTDQMVLATVVLEDKVAYVRQAAMDKLTDQMAFAKVAMEATELSAREIAIRKLNDKTLAMMGMWVKPELTEQVHDQVLLSNIADKAKYWRVREAAVSKLTDQAILAKAAVEDKVGYVRAAAVRKLTDQTLLRKLAQTDKVATIRVAAVVNITDIQFLFDLANTDSSLRVRSSVVANLKEPSDILRFATEGFHTDVRDKAYSMLSGEIALQARQAQALISERAKQLRQEPDSTRLMDQCLNGKYDVLRWAAAESLLSDNELLKVAVSSCDRQVLRRVLGKITDRVALNEIATSAKDIAMRIACSQKSGAKSWDKIFAEATGDSDSLGNAMAAVALSPTVQDDARTAVQDACLSLIRSGDESRIPEMVDLLEGYGDNKLCEDYMNCGQPDLVDAGTRWVQKRGYNVRRGIFGSVRAKWGGM